MSSRDGESGVGSRIDRRTFLAVTAGGLVAGAGLATAADLAPNAEEGTPPRRFRAVAFDAFPVFDPRPVSALAEEIFPGKGSTLSGAWRTRQFEYQWLRALAGEYADFRRTSEDALAFAARSLDLDLTHDRRARLMHALDEPRVWPDAVVALRALRAAGIRLAFLSNMTEGMLQAGIRNAGLEGTFEQVLSTDRVRTYKPDPRAYRLAVDALRLEREQILFAAFAGWDVAGAKWFGYPTFWVNRLGVPLEELGAVPDGVGPDLGGLSEYVLRPA